MNEPPRREDPRRRRWRISRRAPTPLGFPRTHRCPGHESCLAAGASQACQESCSENSDPCYALELTAVIFMLVARLLETEKG
jgi:hypothetical protein